MGERAHTPGRERPILFSAPMVRALLDGRKAQTRRIIKPQPVVRPAGNWSWDGRNGSFVGAAGTHLDESFPEAARFHSRVKVGDRLWVCEAWRPGYGAEGYREELGRVAKPSDFDPATTAIEYLADGTQELCGKSRPGLHMPRWASRLTLTVTDVRVQRLQDISEEDAVAEGIEPEEGYWRDYLMPVTQICVRAADSYRTLWDSINGAGSWDANPWVAAYAFTVERRNIDAPATAAKTGGA